MRYMSASHATNFDELSRTLSDLHLGIGAAELHGSLTGYLCAGGMAQTATWLQTLALNEVDDALSGKPDREVFDRFFVGCAEELDDPDLSFAPMLPGDASPIEERAVALVDWCRGFLGGIGLAGADLQTGLSGDSDEILRDLSRIAATRFDEGDSAEDDEEAYAEVVEYVRVGVLLLHNELGAQQARQATRH